MKTIFYISTPIIVLLILFLWLSGSIGLWSEGIARVANNTKKFTTDKGHVIQGEYSITIDLSNLESNIGKVLYDDGTYKIYVSWVDNTNSINSGGYRIGFRSKGKYSTAGASLISGGQHVTNDDNSFSTNMISKMTADYKNRIYTSSVYGVSGLNYKDGDDFSFYIFPSIAYKKGEVSLSETGIVTLTIIDLFKNVWSKR